VATVVSPRRRVNLERRLSRADVRGNAMPNYLSHVCIIEEVSAHADVRGNAMPNYLSHACIVEEVSARAEWDKRR